MTIYQLSIKLYNYLPLKKLICLLIRILIKKNNKFYRDLRFKGLFKVKIDDNHEFKMIHHGGTVENEVFWKGLFTTFESENGWLWTELCKKANTIFDIGANTGIYSLISKSLNPECEVFAFEPSKHTFHKLKRNNDINKYDIKIQEVAVSNKFDSATFYDFKNHNQTSASLSRDMYRNNPNYDEKLIEYNVKTITLSDFIESNSISCIDLMKIDVEMHEPEVIEGFGKYILIFKPIIFIEVLSESVANKLNDLIPKEYLKYHLDSFQKLKPVKSLTKIKDKWNYLLVHEDNIESFKSIDIVKKNIKLYEQK